MILPIADITDGAIGIATVLLSGGFLLALRKLYTARAEKDSIIVGSAEDLATVARELAEGIAEDRDYWRKRAIECEREVRDLASDQKERQE